LIRQKLDKTEHLAASYSQQPAILAHRLDQGPVRVLSWKWYWHWHIGSNSSHSYPKSEANSGAGAQNKPNALSWICIAFLKSV